MEWSMSEGSKLTQSWSVPGGRIWFGRLLLGFLVATAVVTAVGAVRVLLVSRRHLPLAPSLLLFLVMVIAVWLCWKVARTVWMVGRTTGGELVCWSITKRWMLRPGEVLEVRGDAYGLFLVVVTRYEKIWLWGHLHDRAGLLSAIERVSPSVEFDRYVSPR
jgi:hypothetical protein